MFDVSWNRPADYNMNTGLMEVNANGLPLKGYNEKMQELSPEEFGKFAVGAQPKHAFQMPSVHGREHS